MPGASSRYDLIVVGGGAAGFYGAIQTAAASTRPLRILILEKGPRLLGKVAVSGGGRCNVTHDSTDADYLHRHYPRGGRMLRSLFARHHPGHVAAWFASQGVQLKTEADGRMFPVTDDSATIVHCLQNAARKAGIEVRASQPVSLISPVSDGGFILDTPGGQLHGRCVLLATGGLTDDRWLAPLALKLVPPVPSLFSLHLAPNPLEGLQGISVSDLRLRLQGTKLEASGPAVITHRGISGPAMLRLSAWAARELHACQYQATLLADWTGGMTEAALAEHLELLRRTKGGRPVLQQAAIPLPARLWERLATLAGATPADTWGQLPAKLANRLKETLLRQPLATNGKSTNKDEFVTCGGVALDTVEKPGMHSSQHPGLFLAGEVLDVDGLTGGFNFQAAWTTGWLAAQAIAARLNNT